MVRKNYVCYDDGREEEITSYEITIEDYYKDICFSTDFDHNYVYYSDSENLYLNKYGRLIRCGGIDYFVIENATFMVTKPIPGHFYSSIDMHKLKCDKHDICERLENTNLFGSREDKDRYMAIVESYKKPIKEAYINVNTKEDAMGEYVKIVKSDGLFNTQSYAFNGDFIEKVIFNDPATIILWKDGTKTVVKCGEDEIYNPEFGMAMAICKKVLGNKGNYYNVFSKWLPEITEDYVPEPVEIRFSHDQMSVNITLNDSRIDRNLLWKIADEAVKREVEDVVNANKTSKEFEKCIKEIEYYEQGCTEDGCAIPEKTNEVITLENGYAPHYDVRPKKDIDEWVDYNPEDYLGDNSYERWKVNTPFNEKIRDRRKALGIGRGELAEKIGVGESTVAWWETGRSYPNNEEKRQALAKALNFELDELYKVKEIDGEIQTRCRKAEANE